MLLGLLGMHLGQSEPEFQKETVFLYSESTDACLELQN